jgi:hypothetical protein
MYNIVLIQCFVLCCEMCLRFAHHRAVCMCLCVFVQDVLERVKFFDGKICVSRSWWICSYKHGVLLMRPRWSKRSVQDKAKSQKNLVGDLQFKRIILFFKIWKYANVFWHSGLLMYTILEQIHL